jgi:hypothetical protein
MSIIELISAERLHAYQRLTSNQRQAVALHNHTLQLASSLMSMIALLELALRNTTNQRIIEDFGDSEWLLPSSSTLPLGPQEQRMISKAHSHAQRAMYAKLSYKEKAALDGEAFPDGVPPAITHSKKVKARQALFEVSHGQVISQTTIAFWKRLYSGDYEKDLWKPSLKRVFPNKKLKRSQISKALESIYAARNRVAHHEPVYGLRLEQTMDALTLIRNSIGTNSFEQDSPFKKFSKVLHLRLLMDYEGFKEAWDTLTLEQDR